MMIPEHGPEAKTAAAIVPTVLRQLTTRKVSEPFPTVECVQCGATFQLPSFHLPFDPRCAACDKLRKTQLEIRDLITKNRRQQGLVAEMVPAAFKETIVAKLPDSDASKTAQEWRFNPHGLLLYGPTRSGKSRTAWLIIQRELLTGRSVSVINSLSAIHYAALFAESPAAVERWIDGLLRVDILFMDDPFKNKLTDSFESAIFSVIDQRTQNDKPIIIALNDTGDTLASRMTQDRGGPMVARLKECCTAVEFNVKGQI